MEKRGERARESREYLHAEEGGHPSLNFVDHIDPSYLSGFSICIYIEQYIISSNSHLTESDPPGCILPTSLLAELSPSLKNVCVQISYPGGPRNQIFKLNSTKITYLH